MKKEFPILGPASAFASRAAIASRKQDAGRLAVSFNNALMQHQGWHSEQTVIAIAEEVGLNVDTQLIYDYRNNVAKYPEWQAYMREHQPPALVVWAKNDSYFPVPGAEGYLRDLKDVDYNILDTGHFALEEDGEVIALRIRNFLSKRLTN